MRLGYVDIAKGIALLCVIMMHTVFKSFFSLRGLGVLFGCIICYALPVFYLLSGYTYKPKQTIDIEIQKKAKRLLIPYFLFSFLLLSFYYVANGQLSVNQLVGVAYSRFALFPLEVADNTFFMTAGNSVLWFFTSLFVSYLLFFILVRLPLRHQWWLLLLYLLLTYLLDRLPLLLPWSVDTSFFCAILIYVGYRLRLVDVAKFWLLVIPSLILYPLLYRINGYADLSLRIYGVDTIICIIEAISYTIILLSLSILIENKTVFLSKYLAKLGESSIVIFSIQLPIIKIVNIAMNALSDKTHITFLGDGGIFLPCFQLLGVVVIGYAVAIVCKKLFPSIF